MWFRKKREIAKLKEIIDDKDFIIEQLSKEVGIKKTLKQQKKAEIDRRYYLKKNKFKCKLKNNVERDSSQKDSLTESDNRILLPEPLKKRML